MISSTSLLVCLFLLGCAMAQDDKCLSCICNVESNCKAIGCRMDMGSLSCGYYQIKLPYYIDCGKPGKKPSEDDTTAWKRCADDYGCATSCVRAYESRYAQRCAGKTPTCETYARVHNGGPNGCKNSATLAYWNKVKACYGGKIVKEEPIMK